MREVAAFQLDVLMPEHARAGVPETYGVSGLSHAAFSGGARALKSGSLQRFVRSNGNSEALSPSLIIAEDVHKVGVLDVRLFNLDRNDENLLLKIDAQVSAAGLHGGRRLSAGPPCFHLVPIDHGYSLPPALHGAFFTWQHWAQAKLPFAPEMLDAIAQLDLEREAALLRSLGFDESVIRTHYVSTTWLQIAAKAGLTLYEIASFAASSLPTEASLLERVLEEVAPLEDDPASWRRVLGQILTDAAHLIAAHGQD